MVIGVAVTIVNVWLCDCVAGALSCKRDTQKTELPAVSVPVCSPFVWRYATNLFAFCHPLVGLPPLTPPPKQTRGPMIHIKVDPTEGVYRKNQTPRRLCACRALSVCEV